MNNVILVGRLTATPEINEYSELKQSTTIMLAVNRNFKNINGTYDTDFIKCVLWNGIAKNASEYCKVGDVVGIKGRIQSNEYIDDAGIKHYNMEVVVERITFMSSKQTLSDEVSEVEKTKKKEKKGE